MLLSCSRAERCRAIVLGMLTFLGWKFAERLFDRMARKQHKTMTDNFRAVDIVSKCGAPETTIWSVVC